MTLRENIENYQLAKNYLEIRDRLRKELGGNKSNYLLFYDSDNHLSLNVGDNEVFVGKYFGLDLILR